MGGVQVFIVKNGCNDWPFVFVYLGAKNRCNVPDTVSTFHFQFTTYTYFQSHNKYSDDIIYRKNYNKVNLPAKEYCAFICWHHTVVHVTVLCTYIWAAILIKLKQALIFLLQNEDSYTISYFVFLPESN